MKRKFKESIKDALKKFNIGVTRYSTLKELVNNSFAAHDLELLQEFNGINAQKLLENFSKSKSQIRQDLFVLSHLNFKRDGYFIEFGAANGRELSNTHLMEKEFGWKGVLAEPAIIWHEDLKINRSCDIETCCVWKDSNSVLTFNQVMEAELSTISNFSESDKHGYSRKNGTTYSVKTISLNDLLLKYNAPAIVDYLSIDTEGSEYEILNNFDFSMYAFRVITCEHNYTPMRDKIYSLLTKHGYQRVFENLSLFDDWYIKGELQNHL